MILYLIIMFLWRALYKRFMWLLRITRLPHETNGTREKRWKRREHEEWPNLKVIKNRVKHYTTLIIKGMSLSIKWLNFIFNFLPWLLGISRCSTRKRLNFQCITCLDQKLYTLSLFFPLITSTPSLLSNPKSPYAYALCNVAPFLWNISYNIR